MPHKVSPEQEIRIDQEDEHWAESKELQDLIKIKVTKR